MRQTAKESALEVMLTTRQVADFLRASICTIRRWSDKGKLKSCLGTDTKDTEVRIRAAETNPLFHVRKPDIEKKQVHAK